LLEETRRILAEAQGAGTEHLMIRDYGSD